MSDKRIYQVSTLQALSLGYTRPVVKVRELLAHGHTGLGTFEGVNGEMIVLDGICYQAKADGTVVVASTEEGVPFASVAQTDDWSAFDSSKIRNITGRTPARVSI